MMKKTYSERHQEWEQLIAARGHQGWSRRYVSPFMSAWCIHQQYCHVNQVDGKELLEPHDTRNSAWFWNPLRPKSYLSTDTWLPPLSAIDENAGSAFRDFLMAIHAASLKQTVGNWLWLVADDNQIRLCPSCREEGYQSIFDQVLGLERCPIHGKRYLTQCPHCGSQLPTYCFERMRDALVCERCNAYLMPFFDRTVLDISANDRSRQEKAWAPFAAWWRCVSQFAPEAMYPHFPYRTEETELVPPPVRFLWVLNAIEPIPKGFLAHVSPRIQSLRHTRLPVRAENAEVSAFPADPLSDGVVAERKAVFNSVARHLRRHYLFGHRECLRQMERSFFVMSDGARRYAQRRVDGCHLAQAYLFWRYSLRRKPSRYRAVQLSEIYLPSEFDNDIRLWAHRVLSAFHERFAAMRISYQMEAEARASGTCLFHSQDGVADFVERLNLEDARFRVSGIVVKTSAVEVVFVGRGPLPELNLPSCPTCRVLKLGHCGGQAT